MDKQDLNALFEKWIRKLRITPAWDICVIDRETEVKRSRDI